MEKDFNEAVNDFVSWHLRQSIGSDVSEEEFKSRLEKRKEEMISYMENFKNNGVLSTNTNNKDCESRFNPFILFLLMMFYHGSDLSTIFEDIVGRKLSKEEIDEYLSLLSEKSDIDNVVKFFEENDDMKDNPCVAPIIKNLFGLKNKLLPYLKELEKENKDKVDSFSKVNKVE